MSKCLNDNRNYKKDHGNHELISVKRKALLRTILAICCIIAGRYDIKCNI